MDFCIWGFTLLGGVMRSRAPRPLKQATDEEDIVSRPKAEDRCSVTSKD